MNAIKLIKRILIGIGIFVALFVGVGIGLIFVSIDNATEGDNSRPGNSQPMFYLEDSFTLGDFTYCVSDVLVDDVVGNIFFQKRASSGAKFVIVNYTIRNNSKETKTAWGGHCKLIGASGNTYSTSDKAGVALASSNTSVDYDSIIQVQPSIAITTAAAFEVNADDATKQMVLVIPNGLFSSEKVNVVLKKKQ